MFIVNLMKLFGIPALIIIAWAILVCLLISAIIKNKRAGNEETKSLVKKRLVGVIVLTILAILAVLYIVGIIALMAAFARDIAYM